MMQNKIVTMLLLWCTGLGALYGEKVRIHCDKVGAFVYVDGLKKSVMGEKPRVLILSRGTHNIKVVQPIDEEWQESESIHMTVTKPVTKLTFQQFHIEMTSKPIESKKHSKHKKERRFIKQGNVVKDVKIERQWQDNAVLPTLVKNWDEAKKYCEMLVLDKHDDWRLPGYEVLQTIIDHSEANAALVDAFVHVSEGFYWSSTVFPANPKQAARVYLDLGCTDSSIDKSEKYKVVCIRGK
ncbi:MAG TPA: DUF1566 domain-containing protein [Epsilonproteobacteria bacterium]|nr:DUF1566 domain-containing protein [Campylobacterota bacterium]